MDVAVMSDFVPGTDYLAAQFRPGIYGMTRNTPGRLDSMLVEQFQQAWDGNFRTELAARHVCRGGQIE